MKADTVSQKLLGYVIKPPEQLVISNSSSSNPSKLIKRPITAVSQSQKDDKWIVNCISRPRHVSSVLSNKNNVLSKDPNTFLKFVFKQREERPQTQSNLAVRNSNFSRPRTASCTAMNNFFKNAVIKTPSAYLSPNSANVTESIIKTKREDEDKKDSKIDMTRINLNNHVRKTLRIRDSNDDGTLEDYFIGSEIGKGAYAVVKLGINKTTSKKVAIKVYEKINLLDPNKKKNVQREIRILAKLSHSSVIKLFETVETPRSINLILEYIPGSSLHEYIKRKVSHKLEEGEARRIFRQIMEGISYFHSKNVSHRDIKLENVLIDQHQRIKLIDFGFGVYVPETRRVKMFCGTPSYMAPEIVMKKEHLSPPCDIWAAGILLYVLLSGIFPFRAPHHKDLYSKIQKGNYLIPENISTEAKNLIQKMLTYDFNLRITAAGVLQDPWLQLAHYESKAQL